MIWIDDIFVVWLLEKLIKFQSSLSFVCMTHHSVMEITQVLWHNFLIMTLIWVTFIQLIYYIFSTSYAEFKFLYSANGRMFWILTWFWCLPANLFSFNSGVFGSAIVLAVVCLIVQSVISDSLQPHGLQHTRLPCPSTSPRVCSNSCPLIGDVIQPSHPLWSPSPPGFNLSQHQDLS